MKTLTDEAKKNKLEDLFVNEAKILGQLEHPNIVPLYDMGTPESEKRFFTMRFIDGQTLEEIISQMKSGSQYTLERFTWSKRVQLIQQLCDAMEYAHSKGVIHCDLKPANIMIGEFGELVVMDWGIAVVQDMDSEWNSPNQIFEIENVTHDESTIVGTPAYISPETYSDKGPTPQRDVFAIGVIMYELLAIEHPFRKDSVNDTIRSVRKDKPKALYDIKKSGQRTVPVELHHICMKAMQKDPEKRYQSCDELHKDLDLYLDGRFPMKCPSTALKSYSQKLNHFIDDHPKKAVLGVIVVFLTFAALCTITLASLL